MSALVAVLTLTLVPMTIGYVIAISMIAFRKSED